MFSQAQTTCNPQSVDSFDVFWRGVYTNNQIDRARLERSVLCLNELTSLKDAQKKEADRKNRFKDRPEIYKQLSDTYPAAVLSRYKNDMLIYNKAFEALSGVELRSESDREEFKVRTQKLYEYYKAFNVCISEDLARSYNPNRIELQCQSFQTLKSKREELIAALPLISDSRAKPNPAPKLLDTQQILFCQKIQLLEENKKTVACNAKAYCTTYTSENAPLLKGTALSSVAADADHSRTNLALFTECDGVAPTALCKANYYRHESSTPENRQFVLGNRPEGVIGTVAGFFTQGNCNYEGEGFIIPRIANEYEDGNQFYDVSNQGNSHCDLKWEKYMMAYKRALMRELELGSGYIDCENAPRARPSQQPRGSGATGSGRR